MTNEEILAQPNNLERRALMALKWHKEGVWRRAGDSDIFGNGTTYRIFNPGIVKNNPALDISRTNPGGYELLVWSGPAENSPVLGLMGADLRGQKRAQRLGWYRLLREAKEAAVRPGLVAVALALGRLLDSKAVNQHAAAAGKLSDILDRLRKGSGQGRRGDLRAVR